MSIQFLYYPKCSTCQKAKTWLEEHKVNFTPRDIVTQTPNVAELTLWIRQSKRPIKSFFNTSGLVYKDLNLKEKLETLSDADKIKLLSGNGMLIKRPLVIAGENILSGFKLTEWEKILK